MSQWLKLVARNALRHRLRTSLTVAGLVVAILSFGVLQTIVDAWYAGVDGAVPSRLITRNALSFTLPLPATYEKPGHAVEVNRQLTGIAEALARTVPEWEAAAARLSALPAS